MAKVIVAYGPPCSGKSSWAAAQLGERDVIYDYDRIVRAMTSKTDHSATQGVAHLMAAKTRTTMLLALPDSPDVERALVCISWPTPALMTAIGDTDAEFVRMDPGEDECLRRLDADANRPDKQAWRDLISAWYEKHADEDFDPNAARSERNSDMEKTQRTAICRGAEFQTREEDNARWIEGYFSVFDGAYMMGDWGEERVDPHAFDETLGDDVRALINHDTTLVLGRTTAGTLTLSVDSRGLFGRIRINDKDQDALNCYERVKRGDVNQCSFGFEILDQLEEKLPDGRYRWTLKRVKLYEVSVCTFPAYEDTAVAARAHDRDELRHRELESWRARTLEKIKKRED